MLTKKKKLLIWLSCIFLSVALIIGGCAVYLLDYYRADVEAIEVFGTEDGFRQNTLEDESIVFEPNQIKAGFIFYPGGKVEHTAYIPLMRSLASRGILCILVKMPFNLAVFDIDAAEELHDMYPSVKDWYIGGHSLGGAMAASYVADNSDDYKGLVLLGAYSTADLSQNDLRVLSVYGSEDAVMNREKYAENKSNLPKDFSEKIINGGCHAYFGMYGAQDGDGIPKISNKEQIHITCEYIVELVLDE